MSAPQSLGAYLRAIRERRGLSLEDVAHVSRVPVRHLAALEREDLAALPAPVFVRGFLRAYCDALGEPPDEALRRYRQLAGPPAPPVPARPAAPPRQPRRSRSTVPVSLGLLVVLGLALFGVTVALQPGRQAEPRREEPSRPETMVGDTGIPAAALDTEGVRPAGPPAPAPASPVLTGAPPAAPTVAATRSGSAPPANGVPVAPPAPDLPAASPPGLPDLTAVLGPMRSPYRLVAYVSEPTWIRVRMADGRVSEETVPAGQTREWVSNAPFVITLGNAGGVSLELNGQSLPALGRRGAVIPRLVLPPVSPQ